MQFILDNTTFAVALSAVLIGAVARIISTWIQSRASLKAAYADVYSDRALRKAIVRWLSHKKVTERSFDSIQKRFPHMEATELRKSLVAAGADQMPRTDPDGVSREYWHLAKRKKEWAISRRQFSRTDSRA